MSITSFITVNLGLFLIFAVFLPISIIIETIVLSFSDFDQHGDLLKYYFASFISPLLLASAGIYVLLKINKNNASVKYVYFNLFILLAIFLIVNLIEFLLLGTTFFVIYTTPFLLAAFFVDKDKYTNE